MNRLRQQIMLASAIPLLLFGGGSALIMHELGHWNLSAAQLRLCNERALLDGQFQVAMSRATSEWAGFLLAGDADYRAEARVALEVARNTLERIKHIEAEEHALPIIGSQWHQGLLPVPGKPVPGDIRPRQESLLKLLSAAIAELEVHIRSGGETSGERMRILYANERFADQLWADASATHARMRSDSQQTVDQHHRLVIGLIFASLLALALAVAALLFFIGRGIVRPVIEVAGSAGKVARGDLDQRVDVCHRNEIGELQGSFNEMVAHLACQRAEIDRLVDSLTRARDAAELGSHAKSDFLAKMNHEIRTPMHGILLALDLLHSMVTEESQRELTEVARHSARAMVALIDDALDLTRIESGRLRLECTVFDLHEMLRNLSALEGRRAAAKGLTWKLRIGDNVPPRIWGDQLRLNQILRNLLDNAIRFTSIGAVGIDIQMLPSPEHAKPEKGMPLLLRFSVHDTGAGISADFVEHIFEPFRQADESTTRKYGGSGLGLAIVRQLVELMGGETEVESLPGVCSRISFTARFLPDARRKERQIPPPPARLPLPAGKRVLLVEDNPGNRLVVHRLLTRAGVDVRTAENGRKAIEEARNWNFDLILMDCCMPETDGFEAAREIRALDGLNARVPIIALTAFTLDAGVLRSRSSGMDGFLGKPYTEDQLLDLLHHWLDEGSRPAAMETNAVTVPLRSEELA